METPQINSVSSDNQDAPIRDNIKLTFGGQISEWSSGGEVSCRMKRETSEDAIKI